MGAAESGRDHDMEITLQDTKVSRCHAELMPAPKAVLVTDLQSRNGTFLDGRQVTMNQTLAESGSLLRIGQALLKVFADIGPFTKAPIEPEIPNLLGGPCLNHVRALIRAAAPARNPVLIEGETGVGKEVVANALHAASGRSGELVTVNCAALPKDLIESELFGHVRGAFSGSDRSRRGLFRSADEGTLFLDEIGEMPMDVQAKLLRVLETGEVRAVGEDRSEQVKVRVVAATNRDVNRLVASEGFRADLFHRLASTPHQHTAAPRPP